MSGVGADTSVSSRLKEHLRGHLLRFDSQPPPAHSPTAGLRILLLAMGLEVLRLALVRGLAPMLPLWVLVPLLLGSAVVLVPLVTGVPLSQLGLRRWSAWTTTEKSYFLQVMLLASGLLLLGLFTVRGWRMELMRSLGGVFVPYLFFGFYQELVYRGLVQTELVRRWGVWAGIFAANVLYTFGPLHANYYGARAEVAVPMFASIFLIGLFFGVLYRRSGNLWIVGCFHAIGNAALVWRLGSLS
jgi:membrane protease YdiL (CAAX protease family)